jgi:hypothetical protein
VIFDRTQNDVDTAIILRDTKVKNFEALTENEIATLEKGMLTTNTLNRIEAKQEELKNLFNEIGYWNTPITNKTWGENDIFNADEFQRILDNTNVLRQAFFVYKGTPTTPLISYHWQNINALEKILYDLDVMINDVKSHYKECGTFESGE